MIMNILVLGDGTDGVIHTGYRNFASIEGARLNVAVDAQNDGDRVHIKARGEKTAIMQLISRLKYGPPRSRVLDVQYFPEAN